MKQNFDDKSKWLNFIDIENEEYANVDKDGKINIYKKINNKYKLKKKLEEPSAPVCSLIHLENGYLASGNEDGEIKIWDARDKHVIRSFKRNSSSVRLLFYMGDAYLMSASDDRIIRIWNRKSGKLIIEFDRTIIKKT